MPENSSADISRLLRSNSTVNAGLKMHQLAGAKMHHPGGVKLVHLM